MLHTTLALHYSSSFIVGEVRKAFGSQTSHATSQSLPVNSNDNNLVELENTVNENIFTKPGPVPDEIFEEHVSSTKEIFYDLQSDSTVNFSSAPICDSSEKLLGKSVWISTEKALAVSELDPNGKNLKEPVSTGKDSGEAVAAPTSENLLDEPVSEIHCEFTVTLDISATEIPTTGNNSLVTADNVRKCHNSANQTHTSHLPLTREANDPKAIFVYLFAESGRVNLDAVRLKIAGHTLEEILMWVDVDHYNLLEKAVIYDDLDLVRLLLQRDVSSGTENHTTPYSFANMGRRIEHFKGAIHLAAFLGSVDIIQEFLDHNPSLCSLRGSVRIHPVAGPPCDLFRIIGYGELTKNPRLMFQMMWLKKHPEERPVHYAICGGYPAVMNLLMSCDDLPDLIPNPNVKHHDTAEIGLLSHGTHQEKDSLLGSLIRQAAACASYSCLSSLLEQTPDAMYMRDQKGWLYIMSGLSHGMQFLRFLLEHGFAVRVLNNVDGRNTLSALHIFYDCLDKPDGVVAKFSEVYDVTEFLLGLGVDVGLETTALSHDGIPVTALHRLMDHINLVITAVTLSDKNGLPFDSRLAWDAQQVFDESIRDSLVVALENGFPLRKHCLCLLQHLFCNRNYLKRYQLSTHEQGLVKSNYGIRNMYNVAKILLSEGSFGLSPAARDIMTPSLSLVDTLRHDSAIECVFGERRSTQIFTSCLGLLYQSGDQPNVYPFHPQEESYIAPPLLHLCNIYLDYICRCQMIDSNVLPTTSAVQDTVSTLCQVGAHTTCFMNVSGCLLRHGVFDHCRQLFHVIRRQLLDQRQQLELDHEQLLAVNAFRLDALYHLSKCLVHNGARLQLEEYSWRKTSHLPPETTTSSGAVETTLLGQTLSLGFDCLDSEDPLRVQTASSLLETSELRVWLNFLFRLAGHEVYYGCIRHVLMKATNECRKFSMDSKSYHFLEDLHMRAHSVRPLTHLSRLIIRQNSFPTVRRAYRQLPLPRKLVDFLVE